MTKSLRQILQDAKHQLQPVSDSGALDAEILLAHALQKPRSYLHAWPEKILAAAEAQCFGEYLRRRQNLEPIAYITGRREFWSMELEVTPDTLIPRPETEILVSAALDLFPDAAGIRAADLGTGSGAIALALACERRSWQIYATDISQSALQIAGKNAQRLGLANVSFSAGNWLTALPDSSFHLIASNPPYVAESEWEAYAGGLCYEPRSALVSEENGLRHIREIIHGAAQHLLPGGYVLVEHGFLQGEAVRAIFNGAGYKAIHTLSDLAGNERVSIGRK